MVQPEIRSSQSVAAQVTDDEPQDTPFEEHSLSQQMAREAAPAPRKPPGSPQLWPYKQLPRRMRAQFFDMIRRIDSAQALTAHAMSQKFGDVADYLLLVADAEDALRIVVHPSSVAIFDQWVDEVDDEAIMDLLVWYIGKADLGEATGS